MIVIFLIMILIIQNISNYLYQNENVNNDDNICNIISYNMKTNIILIITIMIIMMMMLMKILVVIIKRPTPVQ